MAFTETWLKARNNDSVLTINGFGSQGGGVFIYINESGHKKNPELQLNCFLYHYDHFTFLENSLKFLLRWCIFTLKWRRLLNVLFLSFKMFSWGILTIAHWNTHCIIFNSLLPVQHDLTRLWTCVMVPSEVHIYKSVSNPPLGLF